MLYAYRLRGGGGALEIGVRGAGGGGGGQGVAEGQLSMVRYGMLPITGVRGWGDRLEAHMDHAWLLTRSHAQAETHVHSGELGAVQVEGDDDNDDARSGINGCSKGSKGRVVGRPRKSQKTTLPSVLAVPPAAQVADWQQQQQAQPQWQQRAVVAEGEVVQPRGKLQEARDTAKAAEAEMDQLRARVKELEARKPQGQGPVQQQGTPTQVVRRRRLPGARCSVRGATPAGHRLDRFDAGRRAGGGGGVVVQALRHQPYGRRPGRQCGASGHSIY